MGEPYQHSLTLQRLGTYLSNDGKQVFYSQAQTLKRGLIFRYFR